MAPGQAWYNSFVDRSWGCWSRENVHWGNLVGRMSLTNIIPGVGAGGLFLEVLPGDDAF